MKRFGESCYDRAPNKDDRLGQALQSGAPIDEAAVGWGCQDCQKNSECGPAVKTKLRSIAGPVMALALFALAVRLLIREAQHVTWEDFLVGLTSVPLLYLGFAVFLVALNYGLLISYDLLALRYVCRSLPLRRVALVSFLGFTLGNNLGTLLAAAPIRYRFYHRWGLSHSQIVALVSVLGLTFWSGICWLGGTLLVIAPIQLPADVDLPFGTRMLGVILLTIAIGYTVTCVVWRKPWPIGKLHLRLPRPGLAAVQASVAAVDLVISATALYLVLPGGAIVPFQMVLAAYLVGITISLITQVPGGLGVLELILLTLLKGSVGQSVLASVLIFRVIYYLIPLVFGMVALVAHEIYGGLIEARIEQRVRPAQHVVPLPPEPLQRDPMPARPPGQSEPRS